MSERRKRLAVALPLLALFATVLLVAGTGTAAGAESIDECTTITEPGVYRLVGDISNNATCVQIISGDVVFDGMDHTVQGLDTDDMEFEDTGILVDGSAGGGLENVTVRNVSVSGYRGSLSVGGGIWFNSVTDSALEYVSADYNRQIGINFNDAPGITLSNVTANHNNDWGVVASSASANMTVKDSEFDYNGRVGFEAHGPDSQYTNNSFSHNGWNDEGGASGEYPGLWLTSSDVQNSTVRDNVMNNNTEAGIWVTGTSPTVPPTNNLVVNNRMEDNGQYAIYADPANTYRNNTVRASDGAWEVGIDGIDLEEVDPARFENLDIGESTLANTTVGFDAGGVKLRANASDQPDAPELESADVYFDAQEDAAIGVANGPYLEVELSYEDSTVAEEDEESLRLYWYDETDEEWKLIWHSFVDTENQTVHADVTDIVESTPETVTFGVFSGGEVNQIDSAGTISTPGTYQLVEDLAGDETLVEIVVDDVHLDGNGHTLLGEDPENEQYGVHVNGSSGGVENVTVTDVEVEGWDSFDSAGLFYEQVHLGEIDAVVATGNRDGIRLLDSSQNVLNSNTVTGNPGSGFTPVAGILLDGSDNNEILDSNASDNGNGIYLIESSDNTLTNNTANGNDEYGIILEDHTGTTLTNNTANDNDYGFYLWVELDDVTLTDSTARNNQNWDLYLWDVTNLTADNLDLGDSTAPETTLSFEAENVKLRSNASPPAPRPGLDGIGRYFEAENTDDAFLDVDVHYDEADVTGVDESTLSLWRHDGVEWTEAGDSSVDTTANVVTANVTGFSTFGVFGDADGTPTGTIGGTVTDQDTGDAIAGAEVDLLDDGGQILVTDTTPAGGAYSIEFEAGEYDVVVAADGYETASEENVTIEGDVTTSLDVALSPESDSSEGEVIASSLTHAGGSPPEFANLSLDTFVASGLLQVQLTNDTAPSDDTESLYELAGVGVDETTVFQIELQLDDFDPRVLVGSGNVSDWDVEPNGDGTTNVTVTTRPIEVQSIVDDGYEGGTPDLEDWPEGENDTATEKQDAAVMLAVDSLNFMNAAEANQLNGTILATDAQVFGSPQYTPASGDQPPELSLFVAGPHNRTDGTQNEGFYDALLPEALIDQWGIADPENELTAAYDGQPAAFEVDETAAGDVRIEIDLHYSAGDVSISAEADDGGDGGSGGDDGSTGPGPSDDERSDAETTTPTPTTESTPTPTPIPEETSPETTETPTQAGEETPPPTSEATQPTQAPATTSSPGQPGFGVVVTALALLAAALVAGRRR